jgi:hypothetical protein
MIFTCININTLEDSKFFTANFISYVKIVHMLSPATLWASTAFNRGIFTLYILGVQSAD